LLQDPRDDGFAHDPTFSPNGRFVLTLAGFTARLWSTARRPFQGAELQDAAASHSFRDDRGTYWSGSTAYQKAAFSADGRLIVAPKTGDVTRTWRTATLQHLAENPECHRYPVLVAFTQDATRVVTVRRGGSVWLWDPVSGAPISTLFSNQIVGSPRPCSAIEATPEWNLPGLAATAAALSSDDRYIVIGTADGTVRILRIFPTTQELMDYARRLVPRTLTPEERERLLLDPD
jgi:WD40 repeat protein